MRISADGKHLLPPREGTPFIATPAEVEGRTGVLSDDSSRAGHDTHKPIVRIVPVSALQAGEPRLDAMAADLWVLDHDLAAALAHGGGERHVRRLIRRLRSTSPRALVAAPASAEGPFDTRDADVVLARLPDDPAEAAAHGLEQGVRSAGRPVLVDVRAPGAPAESLIAALDVGVAGALVRTGDDESDRRFVEEALRLEAARLDDAPLISVVVCNYNGARYLESCLASLADLPYPRYEVIVCDDGSTDESVGIARRFDVRLLELPHAGLATARNRGVEAARGDVVVFLDADAVAQPRWLERTWRLIDRLGVDGAGGPNLPFRDAGWAERVVSAAPGPPMPVVKPDGSATHIVGANMAFRRDLFDRVGGFDPAFVASTDDVEFCLRAIRHGARLALAPTAAVLHHRRDSIRGFLRQQRSYGASSAMENAPEEEMLPVSDRPMLSRLNPLRPRYVMTGPQRLQLYGVTNQPLHVDLPVKILAAGVLAGAAGAPLAALLGRLRIWAAICAAAVTSVVLVVTLRAPVFAPARGLRGAVQRLATGALWIVAPAARSYGVWSQRRRRRG